ncbi:MAG: polysaccharide pyruvyl transferase family protein [Acidobacteria bacterium]|nr:polysaccharide pyruvyl transferase family protein [Acidobacteriota bacterium]
MKRARFIHINNGVGSGNIGDELMAQEFWKLLPAGVVLDVPVLPDAARYRGQYPKPHRYSEVASSASIVPNVAGLLVGDTPVAEFEGLGYPLGTIGPALTAFAISGLPVDAIAVGVDRLHSPEARRLFAKHYSKVRSWTVRSFACREALLDLGVPEDRIRVAADLAWLFTANHDADQWAAEQWADLGIDTGRALLVVNVVHHTNSADQTAKRAIASALDQLASERGYQIAFLSNETRLSEHYDTGAAAAVRSLMQQPSVEVPVEYYTPEEMVSLLRSATTVLTQRYHMAIQAILAETIPVCLLRGQKLSGLAQEFKLLACTIDRDEIVERVKQSAARREERLIDLQATREKHRRRAKTALSFFRSSLQAERRGASRAAQPNENPGIAVIHLGGLGDLVLSAPLFSSLRSRYPKSTITLLCRASFVGLIDLFPVRPDQVIPVCFDPQGFTSPGEGVRDALAELEGQLSKLETDIVISAELEPTWLSWYLASVWRAPVNLACSRLDPPRGLLPILLLEGHLELVPFDGPTHRADLIEGDRYQALGMSAGAKEWVQYKWLLAPDLALAGKELLLSLGLKPGEYGVCFPLGAGSTLVKRWPKESFAIALETATDSFRLPVLLTGESHEQEALESHASSFRAKGATVSIFAGRADQIPLLATLLQSARFFLGNDTGPAHLAQAFATPGVVIFGGGTWPHYRPWGAGAVGVVQPLHCFGCRWDCAFGRAMCIDAVSTEGVVEALHQSSANPGAPASMVILDHASAEMQQIVGAASQIYKTSQQDRLARFQALVETHYASDSAQLQLVQISGELRRQEQVVAGFRERQLPAPLGSLSGLEGQLGLIETRLVESVGAAQALVRIGGPSDGRALAEASQAAGERLAIIKRLDFENQTLRVEADRRLDALIEANRIMADQQEELNRLLNELGGATARIAWESERAREFESAAISRLRGIEEANDLLRLKEEEFAKQRMELGSLLGQVEIQGRLLNELEPAAQNRLAALSAAAAEIAEARQAASDRLAAIDDANSLLAREQQVAEDLRQKLARLDGELTLASQRLAVAEPAAAERLTALEDVNRLLATEQANAETVRQKTARLASELTLATQRLAVAEPAAAERLTALEDVNRLLATEQANAETVRQKTAPRRRRARRCRAPRGPRRRQPASRRRAGQRRSPPSGNRPPRERADLGHAESDHCGGCGL